MEVRTKLEGRIFVLYMNPISGRCEDSMPVAAASDYNRLVNWYKSNRCEMYKDRWMNKQFIKGSPLEYYNPIPTTDLNMCDHWNHGICDIWVALDENGQVKFASNLNIVWLG